MDNKFKIGFSLRLDKIVSDRYGSRKHFTDAYFSKYAIDIYETSKAWFTARSFPKEETLLNLAELLDCDVNYFYGTQGDSYRKEVKEIQSYTGLSQRSSEILLSLSDAEREALDIMISSYAMVNLLKSLIKVASFINHNGEISILLENNMWHPYMSDVTPIPDNIKYLEDKLNTYDTQKMFEFQMQQEILTMINIVLNNESWQKDARDEFISALLKRHAITSQNLEKRRHQKEKPELTDFLKEGE